MTKKIKEKTGPNRGVYLVRFDSILCFGSFILHKLHNKAFLVSFGHVELVPSLGQVKTQDMCYSESDTSICVNKHFYRTFSNWTSKVKLEIG